MCLYIISGFYIWFSLRISEVVTASTLSLFDRASVCIFQRPGSVSWRKNFIQHLSQRNSKYWNSPKIFIRISTTNPADLWISALYWNWLIIQFLRVAFHFQLLQNIDYIPHAEQYILVAYFTPDICISPCPLSPLVTTGLFPISVFLFCCIHKCVVFSGSRI